MCQDIGTETELGMKVDCGEWILFEGGYVREESKN